MADRDGRRAEAGMRAGAADGGADLPDADGRDGATQGDPAQDGDDRTGEGLRPPAADTAAP
jgi:hypothetical protein